MGEGGFIAEELAEVLEEIGQGNEFRHHHDPPGQDGDGIVDPAYQEHKAHEGPGGYLGPVSEDEYQNVYQHAYHSRVEKKAPGEEGKGYDSRGCEVEIKKEKTCHHQDNKNHRTPDDAHHEGPQELVPDAHRSHEPVLYGFAPDIVEKGVGDIELAHLYNSHGYDSHQDEGLHLRLKLRELGEQPHGQESHNRPEEYLKKREQVPPGHDPVLESKGPYLYDLILPE